MSTEFEPMEFEAPDESSGSNRRRLAGALVAAMLVAAAAGVGYGIGRSVEDSDSAGSLTATEESDISEEPEASTEKPASTENPEVPATTAVTREVESSGMSVETEEAVATGDADYGVGASSGHGYPLMGYPGQEMELLFERTTDTGFTLRAHLGDTSGMGGNMYDGPMGGPGWQPPPWCFASGQMRIALGGNGVIDLGAVGWFSEPFEGRAISRVDLGFVDGQPHSVVVVQTPPDVTQVNITFDDGAVDSVAPQNGIAVLANPTDLGPQSGGLGELGGPFSSAANVEFVGGSDAIVIESDGSGGFYDPEYRESCTPPPPALPDAGEQPADPAAAEAEIVSTMAQLYDVELREDPEAVLLNDDTGVEEAREAAFEGGFSAEAQSASAIIDELVFTTPTEAWFRYQVETGGIDRPSTVSLSNRYGIAVLIDGKWLITRDTVCQDLAMANGDCGNWVQVRPPSMQQYFEEGSYVEFSDIDDAPVVTTSE